MWNVYLHMKFEFKANLEHFLSRNINIFLLKQFFEKTSGKFINATVEGSPSLHSFKRLFSEKKVFKEHLNCVFNCWEFEFNDIVIMEDIIREDIWEELKAEGWKLQMVRGQIGRK